MKRIAACGRKNYLIITGDEHGARKSVGGCLDIQKDLHFFDQLSIFQGHSPNFLGVLRITIAGTKDELNLPCWVYHTLIS